MLRAGHVQAGVLKASRVAGEQAREHACCAAAAAQRRLTAVLDARPLVHHLALDVGQAADADVGLVGAALQSRLGAEPSRGGEQGQERSAHGAGLLPRLKCTQPTSGSSSAGAAQPPARLVGEHVQRLGFHVDHHAHGGVVQDHQVVHLVAAQAAGRGTRVRCVDEWEEGGRQRGAGLLGARSRHRDEPARI